MSEKKMKTERHCPILALVGRPNVGKSTLFNRITRSRRAIVDSTPGVTRDRHYERVTWDDRSFILIDTGGLDPGSNATMNERIGEQTMQAIKEADMIFFLLDGRDGLTPTDQEIADLLRRTDKPTYYVVNKIDGPELEDKALPPFYELGVDKLWPIAAEHGYGIPDLLEELRRNLSQSEVEETSPADTIRLACFGRPNVGKSSLINRLLGEDRMVVSDIPGTTRDSVDTLLTKGRRKYLLIDTAGIRRKGKVHDKLEKFSIIKALNTLERCDIVLILIDAEEGITEQDTKVIGYSLDQGRACVLVVNKWDLVKGDKKRQKQILSELSRLTPFIEFAPVLTVSALTGSGVKKILPTITKLYQQYGQTFPTNRLNRLLKKATDSHPPAMHRGKRLKFYYTTQFATKPPTFIIMTNYPKGVHFSYHRYLINQFRNGLGLDQSPVRVFLRERKRKKYGGGFTKK